MPNHAEPVHAALKRAWLTLVSVAPLATRLQCQKTLHANCHHAVYQAWDRASAAWPTLAVAVPVEEVLALWAAKLTNATATVDKRAATATAVTEPAASEAAEAAATEAAKAAATEAAITESNAMPDGTATTDCATELAKLRVADLLLAAACSRGDAQALAMFEAHYLSEVPRAIARIVPSQSDIAEIQQQLRELLFVRPASTPPTSARICELAGQGDLGGLVRVIAIRTALNARRAQRRHVESDDEIAVAVLTSGDNPEFVAMRNQHHQLLKAILAQALAALPAKERTVLRMHIVDAMSIDDIGAAHGVHRATAARWLERIREALRKDAMRLLRIEVGDQTHLDSLYRLVDTQFDISFKRLVAAP